MGIPTGAISKTPISGRTLYCFINPLTTMLVEVLISVTELVRMEEKARGKSNLVGLMFALAAIPSTIGTKNAVQAVLLMKALSPDAEIMMTNNNRVGLSPVYLRMVPA